MCINYVSIWISVKRKGKKNKHWLKLKKFKKFLAGINGNPLSPSMILNTPKFEWEGGLMLETLNCRWRLYLIQLIFNTLYLNLTSIFEHF